MSEIKYSDDLQNLALTLTTEWGENYNKPINERILLQHPELSAADITDLTAISRKAEYFVYELCERELAGEISEGDIAPMARDRFPWLDHSNTSQLKNIGMFYARK